MVVICEGKKKRSYLSASPSIILENIWQMIGITIAKFYYYNDKVKIGNVYLVRQIIVPPLPHTPRAPSVETYRPVALLSS